MPLDLGAKGRYDLRRIITMIVCAKQSACTENTRPTIDRIHLNLHKIAVISEEMWPQMQED